MERVDQMTKKSALVIAPGRGSYNKGELGYLKRFHQDKLDVLTRFNSVRKSEGQEPLDSLDGASAFSISKFSRGDNASALIHTCAYMDFLSIDTDVYEIVAVTGNSMGWYTALACTKALDEMDAFTLANNMGNLMQETLRGGQLVYPLVDENWVEIPNTKKKLFSLLESIPDLYLSINLGGLYVLAGDNESLDQAESQLEKKTPNFPLRLANHAGFHSPLQESVSKTVLKQWSPDLFKSPKISMIDGRGKIWLSKTGGGSRLHKYTLGHQIVETYDFTKSIQNSVREFAPEKIIILGPGNTLGAPVAQSLINCGWMGLGSKADFEKLQKKDPFVLSMGREDQRSHVVFNPNIS